MAKKKITKANVNSTLKASVSNSIKKAFGSDHSIHIKESGPSWVNSPRQNLGDAVINPVVKKDITVTINRNK